MGSGIVAPRIDLAGKRISLLLIGLKQIGLGGKGGRLRVRSVTLTPKRSANFFKVSGLALHGWFYEHLCHESYAYVSDFKWVGIRNCLFYVDSFSVVGYCLYPRGGEWSRASFALCPFCYETTANGYNTS